MLCTSPFSKAPLNGSNGSNVPGRQIHPENHGVAVVLEPDLPVDRGSLRVDHVDLRRIVVPLRWQRPGPEFLRLGVELRDPALIHRGNPDAPVLIELQPEVAGRKAWLQRRDGIFGDLRRRRIEPSDVVFAEIGGTTPFPANPR